MFYNGGLLVQESNQRLEEIQRCFKGGQWEMMDLYSSFSNELFVSHARISYMHDNNK